MAQPTPPTGPAAGMMRESVTIQRATTARVSGTGGTKTTWDETYIAGQLCAIQANTTREAVLRHSETGLAQYTGFFPFGVDIRAQDRVTRAAPYSMTLAVKGHPVDDGGRGCYARVPLEETKGPTG